jgi:ectoine hydroxylase
MTEAPTQLTQELERDGYALASGLFSPSEIQRLVRELESVFALESPARVLEEDGRTVRIFYGVHLCNETFSMFVRSRRLLEIAEEALGGPVYVYQSKVNAKASFVGSRFSWHQDFSYWHKRDGLAKPKVLNAILFLDDVTEINGPIIVLKGSHRDGLWDDGDLTVSRKRLSELSGRYQFSVPKGPAGSVLFFDGLTVHGSGVNMSPFDRKLLLVTYSSVDNELRPPGKPSPEYLAAPPGEPLEPLPGDAF